MPRISFEYLPQNGGRAILYVPNPGGDMRTFLLEPGRRAFPAERGTNLSMWLCGPLTGSFVRSGVMEDNPPFAKIRDLVRLEVRAYQCINDLLTSIDPERDEAYRKKAADSATKACRNADVLAIVTRKARAGGPVRLPDFDPRLWPGPVGLLQRIGLASA